MKINHEPIFKIEKVIDHYTKKDGVPIEYVCTTSLDSSGLPTDVFYRETPHETFKNRYFGLYSGLWSLQTMICNADVIEKLEFGMIEFENEWYYSRHRYDCVLVGNQMIDGGRAYIRATGPYDVFVVRDGKFVRKDG